MKNDNYDFIQPESAVIVSVKTARNVVEEEEETEEEGEAENKKEGESDSNERKIIHNKKLNFCELFNK